LLDDLLGFENEAQQPALLATLGDALEIWPGEVAAAERVAGDARLLEDALAVLR
jgi:hypothetical protein